MPNLNSVTPEYEEVNVIARNRKSWLPVAPFVILVQTTCKKNTQKIKRIIVPFFTNTWFESFLW
jgi:hypothetical protein